jgi:hypothetical protein
MALTALAFSKKLAFEPATGHQESKLQVSRDTLGNTLVIIELLAAIME